MADRFVRRIPEPTVVRLPVYQRALLALSASDVHTVSSAELAEAAGVNAAKVRKDLSHLGTYGTPGTGYDVNFLLGQVRRELGLDREWQVVIVGHGQPRSRPRPLAAILDPELPGRRPVRRRSRTRSARRSQGCPSAMSQSWQAVVGGISRSIGVIATPAGAAQDVCNRFVAAGVGAILNFAPAILTVPHAVQLRQVDFSVELQVLAFYVAHPEVTAEAEDASLSGAVTAVGCRRRETR